MKFIDGSTALIAAFAFQWFVSCAKHGNAHLSALERLHQRHKASHTSKAEHVHEMELRAVESEKRTGKCQFPNDAGLVAVTPNDANGGWAMSPDQCCEPGNYCPYACPPGQVMAQWDPDAKSYTYPESMVGVPMYQFGGGMLIGLRMEDSIATIAEPSESHSQPSRTVLTAQGTLDARTKPRVTLRSVRRFSRAMRPC